MPESDYPDPVDSASRTRHDILSYPAQLVEQVNKGRKNGPIVFSLPLILEPGARVAPQMMSGVKAPAD